LASIKSTANAEAPADWQTQKEIELVVFVFIYVFPINYCAELLIDFNGNKFARSEGERPTGAIRKSLAAFKWHRRESSGGIQGSLRLPLLLNRTDKLCKENCFCHSIGNRKRFRACESFASAMTSNRFSPAQPCQIFYRNKFFLLMFINEWQCVGLEGAGERGE
jgi:hypothetical protein